MKQMIILSMLLVSVVYGYNQSGRSKITRAALQDKIEGAWAGKMIGVMYGRDMEYKAVGKRFEGEIPWKPQMLEKALLEDDIYCQLNFNTLI